MPFSIDRLRREQLITAGFEDDAKRSAGRVSELRQRVAELGRELKAASDQRVIARLGNVLAWEDALEILWVESSWMKMKPFPKPFPAGSQFTNA